MEDGVLVGALHEDGAGERVLDALDEGIGLLAERVLVHVVRIAQNLYQS